MELFQIFIRSGAAILPLVIVIHNKFHRTGFALIFPRLLIRPLFQLGFQLPLYSVLITCLAKLICRNRHGKLIGGGSLQKALTWSLLRGISDTSIQQVQIWSTREAAAQLLKGSCFSACFQNSFPFVKFTFWTADGHLRDLWDGQHVWWHGAAPNSWESKVFDGHHHFSPESVP